MATDAPRVFHLTGFPKSGTTWVMNLLDSLPGVVCRGEGRFFASGLEGVPDLWEALREGLRPWYRYVSHRKGGWIDSDDQITTVERQNQIDPAQLEALLERDLNAMAGDVVAGLLRRRVSGEQVELVGDKTPVVAPEQVRRLVSAFPQAPIVFMKRGVKDVVVSLVLHHWRAHQSGRTDTRIAYLSDADAQRADDYQNGKREAQGLVDPETAADVARAWLTTWQEAARLRDNGARLLVVDYGQLMGRPDAGLVEICRFIGADADDAQLTAAVEANARERMKARGGAEAAHVRSGEPGEWKQHLSAQASEAIDAVLGAEARP